MCLSELAHEELIQRNAASLLVRPRGRRARFVRRSQRFELVRYEAKASFQSMPHNVRAFAKIIGCVRRPVG